MTKRKKISYSEFTPPDVAPAPAPEPAPAEVPRPRRVSAPVEIARALAAARAAEEKDVAQALAQVEARAAAAHARELARTEAQAPGAAPVAPMSAEMLPDAAMPATPVRPRMVQLDDEWDDDDEDEIDDRWDDEQYAEARGTRRPLRERARSRSGIAELLMFRVGRERFAVELSCVEEAIDLPEVHHVPEMPPAMLGVITVREALTPVFTPDEALGVPAEGKGAALVFRSTRGRFALAIDDVDDVMTLDLAQLRDAPGIDGTDAVVLGVVRNGGGIVALVDADALVAACQATPLPELV